MVDRVGQYIDDYRLIRRLGAGAYGEVYLGEHAHNQSMVAIKVLRLVQENLKEFIKEASTTFRLRNAHIVQLHSFGISADDTPYLIMDYAPNGTLRERHPKGTSLSLDVALSYLLPLAAALQYAHDRRVVHRDVKPENVLIGLSGEVLLSDFGIAVVAPIERSLSTQNLGGTAPYMAPEQIRGKPQPASDQYALGIIVYEWLCGVRPFQGNQWEILEQHRSSPPPPLREKRPDLPLQIEAIILKALAKEPTARFSSVRDFATAFEQAVQEKRDTSTLGVPALAGDLHATLSISTQEAREGAIRTINLSDGRMVSVQVPAGAQSNQVLILAGQGEMLVPGTTPGNLYLMLLVVEASAQMPAATDHAALTGHGPQPVQMTPPVRTVAPTREAIASPPPRPADVAVPPQDSVTPWPDTPARVPLPPESPRALLPQHIPTLARRSRKPAMMRVGQMLLILLLLGVLALGIYGGVPGPWFGNGPYRLSTLTSSGTRAQANATSTAQARANATLTANAVVTAKQSFYAQIIGRPPTFSDPLRDNSLGHNWTEISDSGTAPGGNAFLVQCGFSNGAYDLHAKWSLDVCKAAATHFPRNFAYQIEMKIVQGDCGGVFALGNIFYLCQDGSYRYDTSIHECVQSPSSGWQKSLAIHQHLNQTNGVTFVSQGEGVDFYINGYYVSSASAQSNAANEGNTQGSGDSLGVAVAAGCYHSPTEVIEVVFSNAKAWTF